jgi:hypothetical protein
MLLLLVNQGHLMRQRFGQEESKDSNGINGKEGHINGMSGTALGSGKPIANV